MTIHWEWYNTLWYIHIVENYRATRKNEAYMLWHMIISKGIQKTKIMASGPIISWQIDGETVERVADFIFLGSKSLQIVIAAMKLKDTYSLEGKLWPT